MHMIASKLAPTSKVPDHAGGQCPLRAIESFPNRNVRTVSSIDSCHVVLVGLVKQIIYSSLNA